MCTASWIVGPDGFELFFNRDEQRTRPAARPPRLVEVGGVRVLAPLDGQDHGTWVSVNEHGLVLCLLNLYEVAYAPSAPRSRGLLVLELSARSTLDAALADLGTPDLVPYRAFTLCAFEVGEGGLRAAAVRWDGVRAELLDGPDVAPPLVSSGFDLERVRASRLEAWRRLVELEGGPSAERLERYHASRWPGPGAHAVSMSRPDACTVSHTRVAVAPDAVRMRYLAGAPADGGPWHDLSLARVPARTP